MNNITQETFLFATSKYSSRITYLFAKYTFLLFNAYTFIEVLHMKISGVENTLDFSTTDILTIPNVVNLEINIIKTLLPITEVQITCLKNDIFKLNFN